METKTDELANVEERSVRNNLTLNQGKCAEIVFSRKRLRYHASVATAEYCAMKLVYRVPVLEGRMTVARQALGALTRLRESESE